MRRSSMGALEPEVTEQAGMNKEIGVDWEARERGKYKA